MRKLALSAFTFAALTSIPLGAAAQGQAHDPHNQNKGKPIELRRGEAGGPDAERARTRARGGDCKSALTAFDNALITSVDPTLRRDRGLCHEQLGHPYPAIDDYRAYLIGKPNAPDADQIRARLSELEKQVGQGGSTNQDVPRDDDGEGASASAEASSGKGKASAKGSVSLSGSSKGSDAASREDVLGPKQGEPEHGYDYYRAEERKQDEAESTGLRGGRGFIVGAFVHVPRFFLGSGANTDMGYGIGGTLRYATGPVISVIGELGYAGVGDSGSNTALGGPLAFGGIEGRIALNKYASDHFILGGGLGFERYTVAGTRLDANYFSGRFRAGFRHVFGPQVGIEFLADGGPVLVNPDGAAKSRVNGVVGGSVAFLVAF